MNFNGLKKILPFFSVAIICMGIVKTMFYYSFYNIEIRYFLSIGEILILFTEDIVLILLVFVIPALLLWLFLFDTVGKWNLQKHKEDAQKGFRKRLFSFSYILAIISTLLYIILLIIKSNKYSRSITYLLIASTILPILISEIKFKYDKLSKESFPNIYWNLTHLTLFSFLSIMILTTFQVIRVDGGKYYGTKIVSSDSIYVSDSSSYFIGKTDNYVFIYNKESKSSIVIPSNKIEKIELKVK